MLRLSHAAHIAAIVQASFVITFGSIVVLVDRRIIIWLIHLHDLEVFRHDDDKMGQRATDVESKIKNNCAGKTKKIT